MIGTRFLHAGKAVVFEPWTAKIDQQTDLDSRKPDPSSFNTSKAQPRTSLVIFSYRMFILPDPVHPGQIPYCILVVG